MIVYDGSSAQVALIDPLNFVGFLRADSIQRSVRIETGQLKVSGYIFAVFIDCAYAFVLRKRRVCETFFLP